jgi:hypothetical protein
MISFVVEISFVRLSDGKFNKFSIWLLIGMIRNPAELA